MRNNAIWWLLGGVAVVGVGWWLTRNRNGNGAAANGATPVFYGGGHTGPMPTAEDFSDADRIAAAETLAAARGMTTSPSTGMPQAAPPSSRTIVPLSSGGIRIPLPGPSMEPMIRADSPLSGWGRR